MGFQFYRWHKAGSSWILCCYKVCIINKRKISTWDQPLTGLPWFSSECKHSITNWSLHTPCHKDHTANKWCNPDICFMIWPPRDIVGSEMWQVVTWMREIQMAEMLFPPVPPPTVQSHLPFTTFLAATSFKGYALQSSQNSHPSQTSNPLEATYK